MGEAKRKREAGNQAVAEVLKLATPGGTVQVRWDREEPATPMGQPKGRMEAITSHSLFLTAIGRQTRHAGQRPLILTSTHGWAEQARAWLTRSSLLLKEWYNAAEQLPTQTVWQRVCQFLMTLLTGFLPPGIVHPLPEMAPKAAG